MDELGKAREIISQTDRQMTGLFLRRMEASGRVAAYKQAHGLPVFDPVREGEVLAAGAERVTDEALRPLYLDFLRHGMELSKSYQRQLLAEEDTLWVRARDRGYRVVIRPGCLAQAGRLLELDRRVCIVTDEGVPPAYADQVAGQCARPLICTLPAGEESKSMASVLDICAAMQHAGFTRGDCVVSVGGGTVGDIAGFAASCYMRGVELYHIPTTLLAQVDASVGGKTGVDLNGVKNALGAFYPPRAVLMDPDTLKTLPPRRLAEGLAEYVKMAVCLDGPLFERLESREDLLEDPAALLRSAVLLKKQVVEADEGEQGLRRVLNFGHTLGHGIEMAAGGALHHGECVALGMLAMAGPQLRPRLERLLSRLGLPVTVQADREAVLAAALHDKKAVEGGIAAVLVDRPGEACISILTAEELRRRTEGGLFL